MVQKELLRIEGLSKSFPGVKALDNINISFKNGSVHALIGENGAGKSTLLNILFGYYSADKGKLIWKDQEIEISSPNFAQKIGIAMVHQENSLLPYLNVMDNIYLGHYPVKKGFVARKELKNKTERLLEELKITDIKPTVLVERLSVAQKQLIEIVKALSIKPKLLMLDEPTAALTAKETRILMEIIEELKNKGVAIIYVSHRLEEVFEISDTISILRDGKLIETCDKPNITIEKAVSLMVGRNLSDQIKKIKVVRDHRKESEIIMEVKNFYKKGKFRNINFSVRKGEILGFAGLVGAGRSELMEAIFGYKLQDTGQLVIKGKRVSFKSPYDAMKYKIALVPEERKVKALFLDLSVSENINIANYKEMRKGLFINKKVETETAQKFIELLNIKTTSIKKYIRNLSGGNQQKAILGRWLQMTPEILILDEPTHGIDVGAKGEIYKIMKQLAASGITILLVSSELKELLMLSDRIIVMHNGNISGIVEPKDFSEENIMMYATGQKNCQFDS